MTAENNRPPLKVSFLIHRPSMSGGARVIARYARLLQERGHDVFLIGLGAPAPGVKERLKRLFGAGRSWTEPPSHYALEGLELKLVHDRDDLRAGDLPDADVVIATYWRTAEWLSSLPPEKGAKLYFIQGHEAGLPHVDHARAAATYSIDARIITVSSWLTRVLADRYGRTDAALAPNAINAAAFAPKAPREKNKIPTVGFLVSKNSVKRTDIAIAACEYLRRRHPDLIVKAFAAKPSAGVPVPSWIELEIEPGRDQIAGIYAACDLWLFTSDEEGYGLPLLEAMASGTPLVARPAGAAPDLVTAEVGALVDSADPALIADAAARLLRLSPDEWKKMSDAALASARAHDWTASFEKFEAALYAAAERNWPPRA